MKKYFVIFSFLCLYSSSFAIQNYNSNPYLLQNQYQNQQFLRNQQQMMWQQQQMMDRMEQQRLEDINRQNIMRAEQRKRQYYNDTFDDYDNGYDEY